jgi:hypothetical protein
MDPGIKVETGVVPLTLPISKMFSSLSFFLLPSSFFSLSPSLSFSSSFFIGFFLCCSGWSQTSQFK